MVAQALRRRPRFEKHCLLGNKCSSLSFSLIQRSPCQPLNPVWGEKLEPSEFYLHEHRDDAERTQQEELVTRAWRECSGGDAEEKGLYRWT